MFYNMEPDITLGELEELIVLDKRIVEYFSEPMPTSEWNQLRRSETNASCNSNSSVKRNSGRKKRQETYLFERFYQRGKGNVKKEYIRCQMIRGLKKANRTITKLKSSNRLKHTYHSDLKKNQL